MALCDDEQSTELSNSAALALAALVGELPSLLLLLVTLSNAGSRLDASAAAAAIDAQPGLDLACWIVVTAVPSVLLAVAARRRYWAVAAIQVCVLLAVGVLACVQT